MAWQTPKTNWGAADVPLPDDFNRIEGNVQELQNTKETPAGAQAKANSAEANAKNYAGNLVGSLSSLATTAKNNIVAAINEVYNWLNSIASTLTNHLSTDASTSQKGHVQLSTSTSSTSTTLAATASAVRAVREMIPSLAGYARVATGSYVGNGAQNRFIAVGATPKFVFVSGNDVSMSGQQTIMGGTGISIESVVGIGNPLSNNTIVRISGNRGAPQITTNGFTVSGSSVSSEYGLNKSNITYRWLAFY